MSVFKGFVGQAYTSDSLLADAQTSQNLYIEGIESGDGQNTAYLRETPGLTLAQTLPTSPVRGIWIGEGRMFAVAGSKLYETFVDNTYTLIGDVGTDGLPVTILPNGNQLFVVSAGLCWVAISETVILQAVYPNRYGTVSIDATGLIATWLTGPYFNAAMAPLANVEPGYIWIDTVQYFVASVTNSTTLVLTTAAPTTPAPGLPYYAANETAGTGTGAVAIVPVTASQAAFLDGVFIVAAPDTKQMNNSAINDGTIWPPLSYASKQAYPDNIASLLADHEELYVYGTSRATEIWQTNQNATAFSCQRVPGNLMQHGCVAAWSPVALGEGVAWLGGDVQRGETIAYRATGFIPGRVSTHAVETAWAQYATTADAVSFVYIEEGHEFWVITFPTGNATWVYDATAASWHRRGWWNGASLDRQRQMFHGFCFGNHYVGDWQNGNIYIQSLTAYTDNGTLIQRQRAAPHLNTEHVWSFFDFFEVLTDAAASVVFSLDWSDDGALTWHAALTTQPQGVAGQALRAIWRRLGRTRDRIFRVTWTAATKTALINAYLRVTAGEE